MSPILTRPVREQFEHDRVIRLLLARYKRKFDAVINPGAEQNASVNVGELTMYPDVVLYSQERGRKLQGTVEVETGESVNTLEAMAEWGPFSRLRVSFVLYVPPNALDTARRLCAEHQVIAAEIWTYHMGIDQVRFTMVYRSPEAAAPRPKPAPEKKPAPAKAAAAKPAPAARPAVTRPAAKAAKSGKPARTAKKAAPARPAARGARPGARKAPAKKAAKSVKRR